MSFKIGNNLIDGDHLYVAFEIGGTMAGLDSALELVRVAGEAGADAIKVQILDVDQLVGGDPVVRFIASDGTLGEEPQKDALRRRALSVDEWILVGKVARDSGIDLIATVDFQSSLNIGLRAGAAAYKICSGDITNLNWIRQVASQVGDAPVLLDTGHASLGELEQAVDVCTDAGASVMIHHVAGGYPATLERVNLHGILALRAMFPEAAIGYSSHVEDWTIDAAAVALGAVMIEKNLTLNKTGAGPEQSAAVAPDEAMRFVDAMQDVHLALGSPRKRILVEERLSRASARRSAWLRVGLARGATVQYEHIAWRRPAVEGGFEPPEKDFLVGRTLVLDLPPGPILRSDLA